MTEIKTCPVTRHAMMIAEDLQRRRHPMAKLLAQAGYEPEHMGESIATVVRGLWEARRWLKWEALPPVGKLKVNGHWVPDLDALAPLLRPDAFTAAPEGQFGAMVEVDPTCEQLLCDLVRAVEHDSYGDVSDAAQVAGAWLVLREREQQDVERRVTAGCFQPAVDRARRVRRGRPIGVGGGRAVAGRIGKRVRNGGFGTLERRVRGQPAVGE